MIHPTLKEVDLKKVMEVTGRGIEDSKYNNIEQSKITSIDDFKPVCLLEVAEPKF